MGKKVNKAVITVPAYFNDAQRQATKVGLPLLAITQRDNLTQCQHTSTIHRARPPRWVYCVLLLAFDLRN